MHHLPPLMCPLVDETWRIMHQHSSRMIQATAVNPQFRTDDSNCDHIIQGATIHNATELGHGCDVHGKSYAGIQPFIYYFDIIMINNDHKIVNCINVGQPHDIFMRSHDTYNGDLTRQ